MALLAKRNPRIFGRLGLKVTCNIAMLSCNKLSLLFYGVFDQGCVLLGEELQCVG